VLSFYPGRDVTPRLDTRAIDGYAAGKILTLVGESEVTYPVPSGQNIFSGVLIFRSEPRLYVPLLFRILEDGKLLWQKAMPGDTPAVRFSIPVNPASQLTIESESVWVTSYFLADAQFSRGASQLSANYVPAAGQGYVDIAPVPRQEVASVYYAGESVPITIYLAGSGTKADVDIHLRPSWGNNTSVASTHMEVALHPTVGGILQGTTSWTVPSTQGPAMLHVKESVAGRTVFDHQVRIGIGPRVDLKDEADTVWGVHLSGAGYPSIYDRFADLWGAKWGRVFLRWPVAEPKQGDFDFGRIDQLVQIYRSQNMRILMVIGENAPQWAGSPGPAYYAAWEQFVNAAVKHLAGKVGAWEIFNEVDAKYYDAIRRFEPDWDITTMRIAQKAVREKDPDTRTVCCSTVTSSWLAYDRRVFEAGLLNDTDIVSLHPYQHGAPEQKDGEFNYLDRLSALRDLQRSFGVDKPIWATEDNWIIGEPGDRSVPEPKMNEQEQAEYVVRANLLSAARNVKFFLHSPYAHARRTEIHVSTWAAYVQMASFFSGASGFKLTQSGPKVFAVTTYPDGRSGAIWSVSGTSTVRLQGGRDYQFFDMYGNPSNVSADAVSVFSWPTYFKANGPTKIQLLSSERVSTWKRIAGFAGWVCVSDADCTAVPGGRRVQSQPSTGAFQLVSPVNWAAPGACLLAHVRVSVEQGHVDFYSVDAAGGGRLSQVVPLGVEDGQPHTVELRFNNGNFGGFKLVLANGNSEPEVSSFTVFDPPEISDCQ
jgi:hypothetical protein